MFEINDDVIHITRGTEAVITFTPDDGYIFKVDDLVSFRVYNRKGLNEKPLLQNDIKITETCTSVDILLTAQDTKIGEMVNDKVEYWYEIEINGKYTPKGFDKKGAKKLILYPEGVDKND